MEWDRLPLHQITKVVTKGTTPTSIGYSFSGSGIPFLRINNLVDGEINLNDCLFINSETDKALSRSRVQSNDVLLSIAGTIGKTVVVPSQAEPMNCNQALAIIRTSKELYPQYLRHWLDSDDAFRQITGSKVTGTISNLSLTCIKSLQIPFPPLEEQKRIAAILDKADGVRRKRREAIRLTEELARSLFLDMFGDPVTNPKGWDVVNLGEIAKFSGGGTPSRKNPEFYEGDICWASSKDMKSEILTDTQEHITQEAIKKSSTKLIQPGTLLIVVKSKVLMHRLPVSITSKPTCFNQDIKAILLEDVDLTQYLHRHLTLGQKTLLNQARGVNTEGLTLEHLRNYHVMMPSKNKIYLFMHLAEKNKKLKVKHQTLLKQSENLFNSLLQRAFRGDL